MYTSTIVIDHDIDALMSLLASEDTHLGRSGFNARKEDPGLIIEIHAEDATAFKTVMSTLAKIFIVWEKTASIK